MLGLGVQISDKITHDFDVMRRTVDNHGISHVVTYEKSPAHENGFGGSGNLLFLDGGATSASQSSLLTGLTTVVPAVVKVIPTGIVIEGSISTTICTCTGASCIPEGHGNCILSNGKKLGNPEETKTEGLTRVVTGGLVEASDHCFSCDEIGRTTDEENPAGPGNSDDPKRNLFTGSTACASPRRSRGIGACGPGRLISACLVIVDLVHSLGDLFHITVGHLYPQVCHRTGNVDLFADFEHLTNQGSVFRDDQR